MRFTKQLAVCIVAVAAACVLPANKMVAQQSCTATHKELTAKNKEENETTVWDMLFPEGALFGGTVNQFDDDPCKDTVKSLYNMPPYAGYLEMEHTKKIKLDYLNAIDATAKEKNGSRTITGVTIGGNYRTIHCNPKNCTMGSLNRFSVLSGAPMMVPYKMIKLAEKQYAAHYPLVELDSAGVWKTVASIMWSEDFAKEDVNAASARTRHLADPTAYGKAQTALKTALDQDDRKFVLNTNAFILLPGDITEGVTVSEEETAVVVTETVVTCTSQGQTDCVDAHDQ